MGCQHNHAEMLRQFRDFLSGQTGATRVLRIERQANESLQEAAWAHVMHHIGWLAQMRQERTARFCDFAGGNGRITPDRVFTLTVDRDRSALKEGLDWERNNPSTRRRQGYLCCNLEQIALRRGVIDFGAFLRAAYYFSDDDLHSAARQMAYAMREGSYLVVLDRHPSALHYWRRGRNIATPRFGGDDTTSIFVRNQYNKRENENWDIVWRGVHVIPRLFEPWFISLRRAILIGECGKTQATRSLHEAYSEYLLVRTEAPA